MNQIRIGQGWDRHRLIEGEGLTLGGLFIKANVKAVAHSDGDVLIHAIIDSLLGALSAGDIGTHFPPSDLKWKNISSILLLQQTHQLIIKKGWCIVNIDSTLVLEKPKFAPYIPKIIEIVSKTLKLSPQQISVKAKTAEKCDACGKGEAIEAQAISLVTKK